MKKFILLLIGLYIFSPLFAQDFSRMVPYRIKNKWGFYDRYGKKLITPVKYDNVKAFQYGYATYELNGKWGILDITGKETTPPVYDKVFGYFNLYKIKDTIHNIYVQKALIDVLKDDKTFYVDGEGNRQNIEEETEELIESVDWEETEINQPPSFIVLPVTCRMIFKKGKKYGLKNTKNDSVLVKPKYDSLILVLDYRANKTKRFIAKKKKFWGIIDLNNTKLLPFKYDNIVEIKTRAFLIKQKNKYGIINYKDYSTIIPTEFDSIFSDIQNYYYVVKNGLMGVYSVKGEEILPPVYKNIQKYTIGFGITSIEGNRGFADNEGKILVKPEYPYLRFFDFDNVFLYSKDKKHWGIINANNPENPIKIPDKYTYLRSYNNGFFWVQSKSQYGYMDIWGKAYFED